MKCLKRITLHVLPVIIAIIIWAALSHVLSVTTGRGTIEHIFGTKYNNTEQLPPIDAAASPAELTQRAFGILVDMKERDYSALSRTVHPEYGVVFSPYATITLSASNASKCFTAAQVAAFGSDNASYVWGAYDGSGEPIQMTPDEYFARFVFDKDFTAAQEIGIDYIIKSGNALENIKDTFPDIRFVDFHIPGDETSGDTGWSSLRLGFEEYDGELMLTVILHSEWTV